MKDEIILKSRYDVDNKLIRIGDENSLLYRLKTELNYRMGNVTILRGDEEINGRFIDPSGGPYITIGTEIDGHIVKEVHEDGSVEFES